MPGNGRPTSLPLTYSPHDRARWRYSERDDEARAAHVEESRIRRRVVRDAMWTPKLTRQVLRLLARIPDPAEALPQLGRTTHELYGRMITEQEFAEQVEAVLAENCRALAAGMCGRPAGYRHYGGRCAACRKAKRGSSASDDGSGSAR